MGNALFVMRFFISGAAIAAAMEFEAQVNAEWDLGNIARFQLVKQFTWKDGIWCLRLLHIIFFLMNILR